jgi:uncharacterized membrane protein
MTPTTGEDTFRVSPDWIVLLCFTYVDDQSLNSASMSHYHYEIRTARSCVQFCSKSNRYILNSLQQIDQTAWRMNVAMIRRLHIWKSRRYDFRDV